MLSLARPMIEAPRTRWRGDAPRGRARVPTRPRALARGQVSRPDPRSPSLVWMSDLDLGSLLSRRAINSAIWSADRRAIGTIGTACRRLGAEPRPTPKLGSVVTGWSPGGSKARNDPGTWQKSLSKFKALIGELGGIRTRDPMIKSHVLYQLSYELSPAGTAPATSWCP
jgi:hypothetical protein